MEPIAVTDRSNLRIMAQRISSTNALQALNFVEDDTRPEIVSFSLNLNFNQITLSFSEPVLASTLNPRSLMLSSHQNPASGESYNLTGGFFPSSATYAASNITISLTDADVIFLETNANIATGLTDTYLSASLPVVEDTNNNVNVALSPLSAETFYADSSPPSIVLFDLDMDDGVLQIAFDDPVNTSTFNPTSITLQSGHLRHSMEWITLSSQYRANSPVGFSITLSLDSADLNEVKAIRNLCTRETDCYMTVAASAVHDPHGRGANPISDGEAQRVRRYTRDSTSPEIQNWKLNMNTGQIIVSFSETIDVTTVLPHRFVLSNSMTGTTSYQLSPLTELSPRDTASVLTLQMTAGDINAIKLNDMLGTSLNNSFLSVQSGAFGDMFSNLNDMVVIRASRFIPDETSPSLLQFSFNAYAGVLILIFDEVVDTTTFDPTGLGLINQSSQSLVRYNVRSGTTSDTNGLEIRVMLSDADQSELNAMTNLATSPDNTYIIASMFTVEDVNGNPLNPISIDSALRVLYFLNSPVMIFLEFPKYYFDEGQTVMLRVYLNTTAASDVTFTLTTEDGGAQGEHLYHTTKNNNY
jgi:hypothetical protein